MAEKTSELNITKLSNYDSAVDEQKANSEFVKTDDRTVKKNDWDESSNETEQIREQIEETRREIGETIDAIQEKLSFSNISEQVKEQVSEQINHAVGTAKDAVYDATVRKAGIIMQNVRRELKKSNIVKTAGEHPVPVALIGMGAGLLIYKFYNNRPSARYPGTDGSRKNKSTHLASGKKGISAAAGQTVKNMAETVDSTYANISQAANSAFHNVENKAQETIEKIGDAGTQVREKYDEFFEKHPLAVGAAVFALGLTFGLAIPSSRYEDRLLGGVREGLASKAEDLTRQALDKVEKTAGEIGKKITEES